MFLYNCANVIWSLQRSKSFHLFILIIFLSKNFNHITKDASIFHFKLSNSHRLIYFPPFRTNLLSPWLTYCKQSIFDMKKYNQPTISSQFFIWRGFDIYLELTWHPADSPFSYSFLQFPNLQCVL